MSYSGWTSASPDDLTLLSTRLVNVTTARLLELRGRWCGCGPGLLRELFPLGARSHPGRYPVTPASVVTGSNRRGAVHNADLPVDFARSRLPMPG